MQHLPWMPRHLPYPKKVKTSRTLLGAVTCKACKKGGRNLQIGLNRGIGCHGIHLLYHHGRKSTFPNRLVNQTANASLKPSQIHFACLEVGGREAGKTYNPKPMMSGVKWEVNDLAWRKYSINQLVPKYCIKSLISIASKSHFVWWFF